MQTTPKVRIFLWNVSQNALATKENLYKRRIIPDPTCSICKREVETTEHLFLLCPWTQEVWSNPAVQIHITNKGLARIDAWLFQHRNGITNSPGIELIASIFWAIWKTRNCYVFRHKDPDPGETLASAFLMLNTVKNWSQKKKISRNDTSPVSEPPNSSQFWIPPKHGTLKINFDGSFLPGEMEGSIAAICRDSSGLLIDGFGRTVRASSAAQTETLALLLSLRYFQSRKNEAIVFEGDNFDLIRAVQLKRSYQFTWEVTVLIT